jgi:hypothetical protein
MQKLHYKQNSTEHANNTKVEHQKSLICGAFTPRLSKIPKFSLTRTGRPVLSLHGRHTWVLHARIGLGQWCRSGAHAANRQPLNLVVL